MSVAVLVPFRGGEPRRDRNWRWVRDRYEQSGYEVVVGTTEVEGFSRTQAILDARTRTDADVLVVADADVWPDRIVTDPRGWTVPGMLHRLSKTSTERLLAGEDWRGLPLSTDNRQDSKPYRVHPGGTFLTLTAEAFDTAPPDPRFVGWGQEDDAWSLALRALVGPPERTEVDVVHLWHPPEPRINRRVGNPANRALLGRYRQARTPSRMSALIEEGRSSTTRSGTPRPRPT